MVERTGDERYDLEMFIDPTCPFCWITSRWVLDVTEQRSYRVRWRWISLEMINEGTDYSDPRRKIAHQAGHKALRVLDAIREQYGNDAVAGAYTAFGTGTHVERQYEEFSEDTTTFLTKQLIAAGYDADAAAGLAAHGDDEAHDRTIRAESDLAFERTGPGVGTPILTFEPDGDEPRSLFGPVISKAPRGKEASRLWEAVETLASTGVAEIKRSLRDPLDFT